MRKIISVLLLLISLCACVYFFELCLTSASLVSFLGLFSGTALFFLSVSLLPEGEQEVT